MMYESHFSETLASCPVLGACIGQVELVDETNPVGPPESDVVVLVTGGGSTACEIVRTYQRSGEDVFEGIHGLCAAFIADEARGMGMLFNDRYGKERIFLHRSGTRTFFASEAKAILAVVPRTRTFDPAGLAELLACGCTLGSRSLFEGIEVLEPGTVVTFKVSRVTRRRYFQPAQFEGLETASAGEFLEGFSESLRSAVDGFVRKDPKVGISLTGGLDSRMIMASLDAPAGTVPCYTFGSMFRTTGDVSVGRQVAASCDQPHQVLELGREFLANIRRDFEQSVYVSDGYIGLSGAAELYVNRRARAIAPARMTGNWGGELMRGVRAFKYVVPKGGFLRSDVARRMEESAEALSDRSSNPLSAALFQQMPAQGYGRYAVERSQVTMRAPFVAEDVVKWLYRAPASLRESPECATAIIARRPALLAIPTDLGLLGTGPAPLRRLRRLRRRAVIKAEYLTSHGAPDWLARLSANVPNGLLEMRFLGVDKFQHFRRWLRRELAGFAEETLRQDRNIELEPWFDMSRVGVMLKDHVAGRANYTDELDKVMTVATVRRTFMKAGAR